MKHGVATTLEKEESNAQWYGATSGMGVWAEDKPDTEEQECHAESKSWNVARIGQHNETHQRAWESKAGHMAQAWIHVQS